MPRNKNPDPEVLSDNVNRQAIVAATNALDITTAADMEVIQAADLYKMVGVMETAHFMETVSAKVLVQTYIKAKAFIGEIGGVTVRLRDGSRKRVSGMDDFCDAVMPVSARRCRQLVATYELLGGELFEQAEKLGFRARDYQALKALPADDQDAVMKAIEGGDKDEVIDLLSDLAARNQAMRKKVDENDKLLAAKDKVIKKKDEKLNKLAEEAELRATVRTDETAAIECLRKSTLATEQEIDRLLVLLDEVMTTPATEAVGLAARQTLDYIAQRLADGCEKAGISLNLEEKVIPLQMRAIREAAAAGRKAA